MSEASNTPSVRWALATAVLFLFGGLILSLGVYGLAGVPQGNLDGEQALILVWGIVAVMAGPLMWVGAVFTGIKATGADV